MSSSMKRYVPWSPRSRHEEMEDYYVIRWTLGGKKRTAVMMDEKRARALYSSMESNKAPHNQLLEDVELHYVHAPGAGFTPRIAGLTAAYLRENADDDAAEMEVNIDRHVAKAFVKKGIAVVAKAQWCNLRIAVDNWAEAAAAVETMIHAFSQVGAREDMPTIQYYPLATYVMRVWIEHAYVEGLDRAHLASRAVEQMEAYKAKLAAEAKEAEDAAQQAAKDHAIMAEAYTAVLAGKRDRDTMLTFSRTYGQDIYGRPYLRE